MRTPFRLVLIALSLALVATACGDDDATTTTSPDGDSTTTTSATATTQASATTTASSGGGDLPALLEEYEMTPLRTTYVFRDSGEETTVTLSQDPTQDPPVEAVIIEEAGSKLITTGDESIFCDTTTNQCFSVPGGVGSGFSAGLLGPFAGGLFLAAELDDIPGSEVSEDTTEVAGRTGLCFTFTPPAAAGFDTGTIRQCVDAELGFTLLIQAQEAGGELETVMELVEFGEPLEDDFTPTGPVTETP